MTPARLVELKAHVARGHSLTPSMAMELLAELDRVAKLYEELLRRVDLHLPAPTTEVKA